MYSASVGVFPRKLIFHNFSHQKNRRFQLRNVRHPFVTVLLSVSYSISIRPAQRTSRKHAPSLQRSHTRGAGISSREKSRCHPKAYNSCLNHHSETERPSIFHGLSRQGCTWRRGQSGTVRGSGRGGQGSLSPHPS